MDKGNILSAALRRFAEHGYQGTSMRDLATDLGVTPGAFYNHFPSKGEVLASLIEDILTRDLDLFRVIGKTSGENTLDGLIYAHVYNNCAGRDEALVIRESHFLEPPYQARVRRMIQEYEGIYSQAIAAEYTLDDEGLRQATKALIGLGSSVVDWYRSDGPSRAQDVARSYIGYCRSILARAETDTAARANRPHLALEREPAEEDFFRRIDHRINAGVLTLRHTAPVA